MAENLIDLKRRINSVKNTQKITRAMKTVAAAKLRKNVKKLNRTESFMRKIEHLLNRIEKKLEYKDFPLFKEKEEGKVVIVALSSDKGLCGAFNSHTIKKVEDYYKHLEGEKEEVLFITSGNKIYRNLNKKGFIIEKDYKSIMSDLKFSDSVQLSEYLQEIYLNRDIKRVEFVYIEFISSSKQEITVKQILPLEIENREDEMEEEEIEYIFEPSLQEIFNYVLPKYINSLVYRILLGSIASEHAARMIAMDIATRNANDMIKSLTLTMNKFRQASITKELLEIITATEALKR